MLLNIISHYRAVCGIGLRGWTVSAVILDAFGRFFVCLEGLGYRKEEKILALICLCYGVCFS